MQVTDDSRARTAELFNYPLQGNPAADPMTIDTEEALKDLFVSLKWVENVNSDLKFYTQDVQRKLTLYN